MEAAAIKIFFKAVLNSLHRTSPPSQVLCDECENGETVIDIEDHKCYYQTMHGFISCRYKELVEEAGRKAITDKLIELVKEFKFN